MQSSMISSLLCGGSIKWSAITSGQYQNTHMVEELYFVTWNVIMSCQSSHCGCAGHCGVKDKFCKDWYALWLGKVCWLLQKYSENTWSLNIKYSDQLLQYYTLNCTKVMKNCKLNAVDHEYNLDTVPQLQLGLGLQQQKELTDLIWWDPTSMMWSHD